MAKAGRQAADGGSKAFAKMRHPRYLLFLAILVVLSVPLAFVLGLAEGVVTAFDVAVMAFIASCVSLWNDGDAQVIRRQAERDDAGQLLLLLLTSVISTAILSALSTLVLKRDQLGAADIALLVGTLIASWSFVNLIYAFHYARLYYSRAGGKDCEGMDFPGEDMPDFSDFVNFAFVIGMTCQTADIDITATRVRRVATFHGLFAFIFNLGILALTVNVLASG